MRKVRFVLVGAGNIGRRFLELVDMKGETLQARAGLELIPVAVSDTSGAAICPEGLDPRQLVSLKSRGQGVARLPIWGQPGTPAREMVETVEAELLLEAAPGNLHDGQPGLACIETALFKGMHVVTADKAPLALAFPRLLSQARSRGVHLRYDATVAGGLPAVNLGQRDLDFVQIPRLEGILNITTNYILTRMAELGASYEQALADAQAAGHAEADPSLDVEGWDAACKLVILAHSVLNTPASLSDVAIEGITCLAPETARQAAANGKRIKPLAMAERHENGYRLSVGPIWLDAAHPLAQLGAEQMGIVYHTDVCGTIAAAIVEQTPLPAAAAMLRDVIDIFSEGTS